MMGFAVNGREPGSPEKPSVLLTGATGYIGGRLVPVLEAAESGFAGWRGNRPRLPLACRRPRRLSPGTFSIQRHSIAR